MKWCLYFDKQKINFTLDIFSYLLGVNNFTRQLNCFKNFTVLQDNLTQSF